MLLESIDPNTVSKIAGHFSASFTMDRYGHLTPDAAKAVANTVGGKLADTLGKL